MTGFIVCGSSGPMGHSKRDGRLYFGVRRGAIAAVFPTRSKALSAVRRVIREREADGFNDNDWMQMRVVRLVPMRGAR
jgi:hypothetical protein